MDMKGKEGGVREGRGWTHTSAAAVQSTQGELNEKFIENQLWRTSGISEESLIDIILFTFSRESVKTLTVFKIQVTIEILSSGTEVVT